LKIGFGLILGLQNTSGSFASETAPARTSRALYAPCVQKQNLRLDARFRLFRDLFRLKTGSGEFWVMKTLRDVLHPKRLRPELRAPDATCVQKHNLRVDARFRLSRNPFRLKTGVGLILGLENTSGSSASETAPAPNSRAPHATCVQKHNLRVDARFRLFRDLFRLKTGSGEFWVMKTLRDVLHPKRLRPELRARRTQPVFKSTICA